MDATAVVDSLVADLGESIDILRTAGDDHWSSWLERGRRHVVAGDAYGLDYLLSAFGGMGSFNDLILSQSDTDPNRERLQQADARLMDLRESIWQACTELKRQLDA